MDYYRYLDMIWKLSNWYFSKDALPYWCIFVLDCLIVLGADVLVYALNNGTLSFLQNFVQLTGAFCFYLLFYVVSFRMFHTYSGVIRYSSFIDLQRIGFAMITGLLMIIGVRYLLNEDCWLMTVGMRDIGIAALLAVLMMWSVRVFVKYLYDSTFNRRRGKRVFIYGVKAGGVGLAKSIRNQVDSRYVVSGFVSDMQDMQGRFLMGKRVYPNDEHLVEKMEDFGVHTLLVSPLKNEAIRNNPEMVERLIKAGIRIYMISAAQEWDGKSDLDHRQLKEVDIEDLLPRDKIEIDLKAVEELLTGKSILITGAAGSIGSESFSFNGSAVALTAATYHTSP